DDREPVEAWAPTGNSRTHAARFARQQAGTSTYYLAVAPELADGFVGSAEIRWDGNANLEVPRCPEVNGLQVWPGDLSPTASAPRCWPCSSRRRAPAATRSWAWAWSPTDRCRSTCDSATRTPGWNTSTATRGSTRTITSTT